MKQREPIPPMSPTPWSAEVHELSEGYSGIVYDRNGISIGADHLLPADAYLVGAAPDLRAALEAIVNSLATQDDEGLIEHAEPMRKAREALAKASGGALEDCLRSRAIPFRARWSGP